MKEKYPVETAAIVRVPVVSPDGGAAWRALYEGKPSKASPSKPPAAVSEGAR